MSWWEFREFWGILQRSQPVPRHSHEPTSRHSHESGNDEILSFRNLSGATETAPPSFPRRRESSLVGTETYRESGFF
ncbi:hypothetical protein, partial [Neisseria meningitidis]|uniref:hypothetical protein n=1 Tax=Neisseria meningitidis TaxID=487 RepID=UPI00195858D5